MADDVRIRQFEKMAQDDPNNELGHFSLGKAYLEAGRNTEAATSLKRALDLNPTMSKAYELIGTALHRAGQRELAIEMLTRGITVADERGDRKPREAIAALLREFGAPVPEPKHVSAPQGRPGSSADAGHAQPPSPDGFSCARCGRPSGKLEKPPFKGPLGLRIHEQVCQVCWREWIGMGTKVINEMGLQLANRAHQDTYDQYMIEFLQLRV
ncbi:MAG: Fe(2+)-trafficking protein [Phycisphaerales bacterium]|nr:Fe(2+)-trafficking protein [Phycisphaerales bacterium]